MQYSLPWQWSELGAVCYDMLASSAEKISAEPGSIHDRPRDEGFDLSSSVGVFWQVKEKILQIKTINNINATGQVEWGASQFTP